MSYIWHTADTKPESYKSFVIKTNKGNVYTGIIANPTEWNPMILPEFYSIGDIDKAERAIRYAYLDDLLALESELERTRKALDVALKCLNGVGKELPWVKRALAEITALKQKDVK